MSPDQIAWLADTLWNARSDRRTLEVAAIEATCGPWTMGDAYEVGDAIFRRRLARGEHAIGWKLGYTSLAMRQQMGIDRPNFGRLTDAMVLADGGVVPDTVSQPRVEPEIAVRLARDVTTLPVSVADLTDAVDEAFACLEIVDSVWTGYRFRIEHNTADASSAAFVVFGPPIPLDDLAGTAVRFFHNDREVATATGAAASGHPLAGVAWLAATLADTGRILRGGEVVITGGLAAALPIDLGDLVQATFADRSVVSVSR